MAIERSPKAQNLKYARKWATDAMDNMDDVKHNLESHVLTWGGDPEQTEYRLAVASLNKAMVLMKIVEDNVRELAREAHLEDLARAKAKEKALENARAKE